MKKYILICFLTLIIVCMTACGIDDKNDSTPTSTPEPTHAVVTDDDAHYLIFLIQDIPVAKILVTETDTYDELKNYFPTIPEKEGYSYHWEKKEVYSSGNKEIYINAIEIKD